MSRLEISRHVFWQFHDSHGDVKNDSVIESPEQRAPLCWSTIWLISPISVWMPAFSDVRVGQALLRILLWLCAICAISCYMSTHLILLNYRRAKCARTNGDVIYKICLRCSEPEPRRVSSLWMQWERVTAAIKRIFFIVMLSRPFLCRWSVLGDRSYDNGLDHWL